MPDAKVIAILRHPVERSYSDWKVQVRRGLNCRSFGVAAEAQLKSDPLRTVECFELSPENETDRYLLGGLYGRILTRWFDRLAKDRVLVRFTDDLANDPLATLRRIHVFLGVSPEFVPRNLGKRYHVGGTKRPLPHVRHLKDTVPRLIWRCLPKTLRRRANF